MIKKLTILPLLLILAIFLSKQVEAKVWTKDLVDKVTLDSGYKFQICTIDLKYDFNSVKDAGFLSEQEKKFEANPDAYPCNKQSIQDVLLANITLNFSKTNWNGGNAPEKLLLIQDGLYSVGAYGSILSDETTKAPIGDISPVDWFSTLPAGIRAIRGTNLINTDPNAPENQKTLENSGLLILHDPSTGKFTGALFMINNTTYKVSNIVSQVTESTTLVDYTSSDTMDNSASNSSDETADWKTYTSSFDSFTLKYPPFLSLLEDEYNDKVFRIFIQNDDLQIVIHPGGVSGETTLVGYQRNVETTGAKNFTKYKISGEDALKYNILAKGENAIEVIFIHKGKAYQIRVSPSNPKNDLLSDQILSTFMFTQ